VPTAALVEELAAALRTRGTPERAEQERRYLKSELVHYGTSVPAIRSVAKTFAGAHPDLSHHDLVGLVDALWHGGVHEHRMVAVELLDLSGRLLSADDLPLLERLLRSAGTWALVDGLAATVVGAIAEREPKAVGPVLDRWSTDADFWLRRSSLLALLLPLRRGEGDFDRFGRYADGMLDEREFFVRKAIGWVLRDTARKRPDLVFGWLLPRAARASGVTIREAVKPLSDEQRAAIAAARPS
jgi:3-methyladenine DNA glycosylase AlkD